MSLFPVLRGAHAAPVGRWPRACGLALALLLPACAPLERLRPVAAETSIDQRVARLRPTEVLLLGEQHDAAEHQQIEREVVQALATRHQLAALVIEMAETGHDTARLPASATEAQVQAALHWNDQAWPWAAYGPVVMAAVGAGVPVWGGNLPRDRFKETMADVSLDAQLGGPALKAQQQAIRLGHCHQLPEAQIQPMTRIQIARDRAMAQALVAARQPGKTVLLVAGAAHAAPTLGVPQHLQHLQHPLQLTTVKLQAGAREATDGFDAIWPTPPVPPKDYCAGVRGPARR